MNNRIASQKVTSDAENLLREPLDLIRQVLVKFETACVAEWRVIVEARKEETRRVAKERDDLAKLVGELRAALALWKLAAENSEECELDDVAHVAIPMPLFHDADEATDAIIKGAKS